MNCCWVTCWVLAFTTSPSLQVNRFLKDIKNNCAAPHSQIKLSVWMLKASFKVRGESDPDPWSWILDVCQCVRRETTGLLNASRTREELREAFKSPVCVDCPGKVQRQHGSSSGPPRPQKLGSVHPDLTARSTFSRRRPAASVPGRHQTAPYKEEGSESQRCRGKRLWTPTASLCVDCTVNATWTPYIWAEETRRREERRREGQ